MLVIGYGNPLRGDDGLGWLVARRLAEEVAGGDVVVLALHQLTPELAEEISISELVIFIDADCEQEPGRLSCKVIKPRSSIPGATTHHLDPPNLLALTQALYGALPKTAILITVSGESFGYKEGLSPIVKATVPVLEQVLEAFINTTK